MFTDIALPENTFDWTVSHRTADLRVDRTHKISLVTVIQAQLNIDQYSCFQTIMVVVTDDIQTAYFYLQGPGSTGKTFLYKTLYYYYCSQGKVVLYVVLTGIAALLLPDGYMSYSQFRILLEFDKSSVSIITKMSRLGALLRSMDLIIWDEVPI
jgi:hypothetical protein